MARKGGGRRPHGGRRPVKGFRPGKEPVHLKRQRARAQLGSDATWFQRQTVDAVAGRTPAEVERMVRRSIAGLVAGASVLAVTGVFLYRWTAVAGVVVHLATLVLLFLAYRLRRQSPGLIDMADSLR